MRWIQNEETPVIRKSEMAGSQEIALAHIAEQWILKLAVGQIHYDPRQVQSRWFTASDSKLKAFKAILNGNRLERLNQQST